MNYIGNYKTSITVNLTSVSENNITNKISINYIEKEKFYSINFEALQKGNFTAIINLGLSPKITQLITVSPSEPSFIKLRFNSEYEKIQKLKNDSIIEYYRKNIVYTYEKVKTEFTIHDKLENFIDDEQSKNISLN